MGCDKPSPEPSRQGTADSIGLCTQMSPTGVMEVSELRDVYSGSRFRMGYMVLGRGLCVVTGKTQ